MLTEPANLAEWKPIANSEGLGRLFTCGRPGRATYGTKWVKVEQKTIDRWVEGLPDSNIVHLVSLLGRKPNGCSEFDYYPFRSAYEEGNSPTIQEWFDANYCGRFKIYEIPTTDRQGIPSDVRKRAGTLIQNLIGKGNLVIVMDSAGAERTARVCESIDYKRINK